MNLLTRLLRREPEVARYNVGQYIEDLSQAYGGYRYLGSPGWTKTEDIETSFTGYINGLYKSNGIVFAIVLARMLLFTEARFCWFEVGDNGENGRPKGRGGLELLEQPWPNCGTGELLARMEQDVSLGGNFYAVREGSRLRRLRPDWVTIVLTAPPAESTYADVAGYWYHPGRSYASAGEPGPGDDVYLPDEICHWSPLPDPDAQYRGMSWLTPAVKEVQADKAASDHKLAFFQNGATLGVIISAKESLTNQQYKEWKANFEGIHSGAASAYKSLFLASPVDTSVLTANMQQLDFKVVQGAGETRLCALGGVPPIIVGLSEGLASATYCGTFDDPVWTPRGVANLGELQPGDEVWSYADGQLAARKVLWHAQTGTKPVYKIRTKNRTIRFTDNHPVLVQTKTGVEWRRVDELRPGDKVVQAKRLPDQWNAHLPTAHPATPDVMQWLGAYTGDGCTNRDHGIRMCIPKTDRVRGHYADLAERLFTKQTAWPTNRKATDGLTGEMVRLRGEGLTYRQIVDRMGLTLHPMSVRDRIKYAQREYGQDRAPVVVAETRNGFQFGSKEAVTWHHDMGVTGAAKTKRVPGWVFGLREDLRLAYLAGVVDTDGSVGKDGRLVIHFANRDLVHDVRMLLVSCGIQCSNIAKYGYTQAALPNPGSQESYEAWRFTASSAVQVARIPFADPLYRARVEANLHRFKADGGTGPGEELGFYTIRSIELEPAEPVYDIEVEDGHSFLVDGVVVHNSNYGMARRKFGDHWGHPQWRSAAQALSSLVDPPSPDVRLGVNTKGIAFLREDAKDLAEIEQIKASTLSTLIMAGYEPDSCVAAVEAEDLTLLKHSGLTSVQLVPPGQDPSVMAEEEAADAEEYDVLLDEFRAELFDDDEIQRDRFAWLKDEIQRRRYYGSLPGERVESGHVGGGQFKELHKRALDAIRRWIADGAPSDADPLEGWKQPQLKKAAEQLGIEVPPRSSPPKLKSAILAHARGDRTPNAKAPAKKATPRAPAKKAAPKPDSVQSARDRQSAIAHARVDGRALRRQFDELAAKVPGKTVPAQEALGRGRLRFGAGDPPGEIAEDLRQAADALEDRQTFGLISPLHFTPAQIEAQRRSDVTGLRRLAKALDKLKPAGPAPGPDSVATARERQAQIDTARMARAEAAVERLRDVTDYAEARELLLSTTSEDDRQLAWHRFVQTPQQRLAVSSEETDETITNRLISSLVPEARRREGPAPIVATQRDAFWGLSKERRARVRERVTDVKSRDQWEAALQAEAPGELESSKERHRAADARLEAARERQAQIDTARTYGDLAAELDELANNEVSAKTLASRIDAFGARHPELTEELAPIRAADPADARRLARELAESHGVKITGQAGDVVPLDRKLHAPIDNTLSGGNVEVIRPGYEITLPDGEVVKVRAKVDRAPDAPAGRPERTRVNSTPKAEPKATPPNPQSPWGQIRDDPRFRWSSVHGRMGNLDQVDAVYVADTREDARAYLETRDDEQLYRIGTAVDIDMRGLDPERDRGAYIERLIDQIREPESAAPDLSSLDTEDLRDTLDLKKLPELKEMLRQRGLKVSGRKRELVDRLVAHERGGTTPDVRALDLGESPTRPSGLPADRKPQSGDFDDLADRVQGKSEGQILEILQDLNATELARLARKFSGSRGGGGLGGSQYKPKGIAIPTDLTLDERRRWLAQRLTAPGWNWRSETPDPDDITRANYDESEDDEPDEDDPGEPGDEQRARAQSLMDEIDDEDEEEPEDEYEAYRAAGMDTNPGGERLHLWWTKGPGLRRWVGSPHPWTTLYRQLLEKVGSPGKAKRMASRWFIEVFGYAAGSDKHRVASGKPPRGDRIGPG